MNWENNVTSRDGVEAVVGRPAAVIMLKTIPFLDDGCRTVLARSPVAAFGYRDAGGTSRTTFIGGAPGFARVLSPTRMSVPGAGDVSGPVSFFFLLPGVGEVLRVNGSADGTTVQIKEAYVHCAQAVLRAGLWEPPAGAAPAAEVAGDGPLRAPGVAGFLAAAPFLALSTWDTEGGSDTSPRGDQGTVARILDGRTLVIPDRKGNKRTDTLHNLVQDDRLSLAALVPGRSGVLHIRGRAAITADPALLATMALRGLPPHLALLVDVEHAEVAGNDAVARARLWNPGAHLGPGTAPDLLAMAGTHLAIGSARPVVKKLFAVPGVSRLMRLAMNSAYRSGLRKEGYDAVTLPAARTGPALPDPRREVRLTEVRRETPSTVTLVLEDGRPFDFKPGQYFTLVADVGGRPVRRAYSASSAPGSTRLEVTVKRVADGRFSGHVHTALRAGDRLAVLGPSGTFHPAGDQLVLVAAGSGITPMMSMIRAATTGRIALLHASRTEDEIIFGAELERLALSRPGRLSVTHVVSSTDGRLDAEGVHRWLAGLQPMPGAHYYICGPDALTDMVQGVLTERGVPDERVHSERYLSTGAAVATTEPQQMTVGSLGAVVVEPGQTLLDAGLAAGLPMPFSCTVGSCGECVMRLRSGRVTPPPADGRVLTCVSSPESEVTLDPL
ncbi:pyridoxamine 5'-phosphate oxidase family protein [Actinoplanes sp. RD1]|uniref:pyridoxamine 5'-phosphate oxidase family protein n=1 Tax=Actinoplanes sp. RD1 TaxID=3064538 RepID=UPI00274074B7|nr:FAD-binding oxidoreductase [Actinoplanes sp. RD1]